MSGLSARFRVSLGDFRLDAAFEAPGRGVTALFGHSGSGKTTLLRCLAGLERAQSGYLAVNGEIWQDEERGLFLPVHRRPLGYVFQEASLFPHLSVRRNLEYGWRRIPPARRQVGFDQAVDLLGIGHLLDRGPARLSGGERQRVAIARALLTSPRLLLMDEPLAALDLASKAEILPYLERLHDDLSIPVLYVSHAPDEVARLADHMVLMERGRAVAAGPLRDMLARLDLPLAHGDEAGTVVDTTVGSHDEAFHLSRLDFPGGSITVGAVPHAVGHPVRLRIHARDVSLALEHPGQSSILNILPATVVEIADENPSQVLVRLDCAGTPLLARITRKSCALLGLEPGMGVFAQVKSAALLA
jgi:molybdate transport system ATP-binding protein